MAVRIPDPSDAAAELDRLEVIEIDPDQPPSSPPLRPFAGLVEPEEVPYARHPPDPTGTAGLWQAISHL